MARLAVAVGVVALAVGVRVLLGPVVGEDRVPYITLLPSLLFVGWYCGLVTGFVAVAVGGAAVVYVILPPTWGVQINSPQLVAGFVVYCIMGSLCVLMGNMVARAEARAVANEQLARTQAMELERLALVRERLATIVESSSDAIIAKNLDGIITNWNAGAERLFGYSPDEAIGQSVTILIPPDRMDEEPQIIARTRRGERIEHYETVRQRKDGSLVDISLSVSPLRDSSGLIIGASKIARDITQRRQHEQTMARYRDHLEEQVRVRADEVMESQSKLRHAERLASIGTLAAGLGHDIGNVLLPIEVHVRAVRTRVDAGTASAASTGESFGAIDRGVEYLRNLSNGLRMLTKPSNDRKDPEASTPLDEWWLETQPLLTALVQRSIELHMEMEPDLKPVWVAKHLLTQVVFNLVQNAAHALADRRDGVITVRASSSEDAAFVSLKVIDNGRGMSPEVRQRCLEPFYTTKTRGISSGLGLSIVNGIVSGAGGTVAIESEPGRGSTFTLMLPVASGVSSPQLQAEVSVPDARVRALVMSMLGASRVCASVRTAESEPLQSARLWVVDARAAPNLMEDASVFLNGDSGIERHILVMGAGEGVICPSHERVVTLDDTFRPVQFREALERIIRKLHS